MLFHRVVRSTIILLFLTVLVLFGAGCTNRQKQNQGNNLEHKHCLKAAAKYEVTLNVSLPKKSDTWKTLELFEKGDPVVLTFFMPCHRWVVVEGIFSSVDKSGNFVTVVISRLMTKRAHYYASKALIADIGNVGNAD